MGLYEQHDRKMKKHLYDSITSMYDKEKEYKTETDERPEKTAETESFVPLVPVEQPKERIVREVVVKRRAMPTDASETLMPLQRVSPEIVGSLFDRVKFLEVRIEELKSSLEIREKLHTEIMSGIDADIKEKENMIIGVSDVDEKRNLKLDISLLMKEKRRESIEFWRDTYTLRSELRELMEGYHTEQKIASIFGNLESKE